LEAQPFRQRREVCANALLTALVFVQRDVQAHSTVGLQPLIAALEPRLAKLQIVGIAEVVAVCAVDDFHIVRRRGDDEVYRLRRECRLQHISIIQ
jgi:hypothetical protein